jgi:hypothetical protein
MPKVKNYVEKAGVSKKDRLEKDKTRYNLICEFNIF